VGDPASYRFNLVPRDFVVDAVAHLSGLDRAKGKVYQLADPHPLTVDQFLREAARATGRRMVRLPLTRRLAKFAVRRVPGVHDVMRIPADAIDYMTHPTHYLTANQADLEGSGIACPSFPDYLPALVDYMRRHADVSSAAMI
jgi:hypothetical protein